MFERFTEDARRALFFARNCAVERDGDTITPEDVLGGIMTAAPDVAARFASVSTEALTPRETGDSVLLRLREQARSITATSKEMPFSVSTRNVLERTEAEANGLGHRAIGPEHLLLGILRDEETEAWRVLHSAGMTLENVRRILREEPPETGPVE
jgi:ATP-dependent Clp protease ATP-binding subunit ClpC